ncbi:hypothetical protein DPX16_23826 [Anabarilius grahami]|uniref:Uncharacterized protein n=1 Tax=Anabarilius grahami TaxID=495550 RepID=A0A3N0XU87_ANAGA|nr:hypothetical protein DPX16_23826 [Anabarilius grahami]
MLRHGCGMCRAPLHADDGHRACEEKNSMAEDLSAQMRVSSRRLRSRVPHSLHRERFPPSVSPARTSEPLPSRAIHRGGSDDEPLDDSMSLAASDAEDWSGSPHDPAPLPSLEPIDTRASIVSELICVLSKAVE